ncbi:hypothetical protein F7725_021539 [Dissostichus mawsoni]|uniref:Reverse transcriptase n=1 Tax=Dissostichus mawsoni TaxID=36200 RepID=A0A7J5ZC43_DISMA|nr:hypothetical protein F7725_021539 [Dissostichus mawsoni]
MGDVGMFSREWTKGDSVWSVGGFTLRGWDLFCFKEIRVEDVFVIDQGRAIGADITWGTRKLRVIVVYGPQSPAERTNLFTSVEPFLVTNRQVIIGGDFNVELGKGGDASDQHISQLMVRCGLVDGGKVVKPHIDSPTWRNSRGMAKRLDYLFFSRSLNLSTGRTIPVFFSDHDGLLFRVDLDAQTFGPGYWRLNVSVLEERFFNQQFPLFFKGVLGLKPLCQGILEWWEVAKDRIKTFCLGYCKMKARRSKREVSQLQRLLEREYAKGNCGATINQNVCDSLKARLRHVAEGKARAFLARSRAEFIEQSETCSAAFFSSVRAKKARQVVTGIRDSQGIVVTEDGQMVRVATDHFRDSFKEKEVGRGDDFLELLERQGLNGLEQLGAQGEQQPWHYRHAARWLRVHPEAAGPDVKLNHRALYKEAREKINVGPVIGIPSKVWRRIQPKGLDNRLKDLNWLCLLRCLPVREIMHRHGLARSPVCPRPDCKDEETIRHVMWDCPFARGAWSRVEGWLGQSFPGLKMTWDGIERGSGPGGFWAMFPVWLAYLVFFPNRGHKLQHSSRGLFWTQCQRSHSKPPFAHWQSRSSGALFEVQAVGQIFVDVEEEKRRSDIVERRNVFNRRRLEKLRSAVAFDIGTVKYSRRSLSTSLKRDCVPRPCAASMSVIVDTFVTCMMGLSAAELLLCACKTAGNSDNWILGDVDAAETRGTVYCCEEYLLHTHQQLQSGLVKPASQLRSEQVNYLKKLAPEVVLWIFPLMRRIPIIITAWSAPPWRKSRGLDQVAHVRSLGLFKDAVEYVCGPQGSVIEFHIGPAASG